MSKKDEALKLALKKAFDLGKRYWQQANSDFTSQWRKSDVTLASFNQLVEDTIRDALAEQPAQQQEPVAWMYEQQAVRTELGVGGWDRKLLFCEPAPEKFKRNITPLYTAPPRREWVGLTDEEIWSDGDSFVTSEAGIKQFARAIEAKLKELNHGS